MSSLSGSEKYLLGISSLVIAIFSGFGFYLIEAQPAIKALVVSGHSHIIEFAFGAILYAILLGKLGLGENARTWLSIWMSTTFLGPLALIYGGITGNTSMLATTSILFEGSFVLLWLIAAYSVFTSRPSESKQ